ncbi:YegP family protein [Seonamhaeicola maritimus]|uniref:YegP family protein n=1 Tax=Seonamhaeicola maritimus TaxID=2591822 RepID=UPI0024941A7C|nr:YegP family protein [Seonamhaeicola maritimus]
MARFKIYKDKSGYYRFLFKPNNQLITLTSEPYTSMMGCLKKLHFFKKHAFNDRYFVRQKAECGSPYFTFETLSDGELLATSETYLTFASMENALNMVKKTAKRAIIDDLVYAL